MEGAGVGVDAVFASIVANCERDAEWSSTSESEMQPARARTPIRAKQRNNAGRKAFLGQIEAIGGIHAPCIAPNRVNAPKEI